MSAGKGKKPTALGGAIFAGLFTRGVMDAGFEVLGHLEHGPYGVATAKLNFPKLEVRVGRDAWHEQDYAGKVDLMYTNPPCAAWSAMGAATQGGRWQDQTERLRYVHDLVDAGLVVKPEVWVWESVTNAWRHGREFVLEVGQRWAQAGYHVTVLLQNNKFIGGHQHRPRVFVIAHRRPLVWQPFTKPLTTREIFAQLPKGLPKPPMNHPPLPASLKQLWAECPDFGYVLRRTLVNKEGHEQAKLRPRPAMTVNRMRWDQTPGVFIGASKRLHPAQPRNVNWYEVLALCGLPLTWQSSQRQLESASLECSRAVMPGVGRWLAKSVKAGLSQPRFRGKPVIRLVDLQDPERVREEILWTLGDPPLPSTQLPLLAVKPPRPASAKTLRDPSLPPRKPGSGARIRELLQKGWDAEKILVVIHREFPGSKATKSDVAWNRGKLRKEGVNV